MSNGRGPLLEICVEDLESARAAIKAGADRLELCRELAADGLTPARELLQGARALGGTPLVALIRPRAGDFRFGESELVAMERSIDEARDAGIDGVAVGALADDDRIDRPACERLLRYGAGLKTTFHRAFDRVRDRAGALEELVDLGFDRVLTSAGAETAEAGAAELAELVARAGERIQIVVAGRVRSDHAVELARITGARALHSAARLDGVFRDAEVRALVTVLGQLRAESPI